MRGLVVRLIVRTAAGRTVSLLVHGMKITHISHRGGLLVVQRGPGHLSHAGLVASVSRAARERMRAQAGSRTHQPGMDDERTVRLQAKRVRQGRKPRSVIV